MEAGVYRAHAHGQLVAFSRATSLDTRHTQGHLEYVLDFLRCDIDNHDDTKAWLGSLMI